MLTTLLLSSLLTTAAPSADAAKVPSEKTIREALTRSLAYVDEQGRTWITERDCVSCHQVPFMLWGMAAGERRGLVVNAGGLAESIDWSLKFSLENRNKQDQLDGGGLDTMTHLILALRDDKDAAWQSSLVSLAELIIGQQQPEGFWKAGGQLPAQKRPKRETDEVSTMWTALALDALKDTSGDKREPLIGSRDRAVTWLKNASPGKSTEWWAARLLLARAIGNKEQANSARQKLLAEQNNDGGWGWTLGQKSDPMATGQALLALGSDVAGEKTAIARAQRYLLSTQDPNGSWPTESTKAPNKGKVTTISTDYGTAWAAIGLLATLDD